MKTYVSRDKDVKLKTRPLKFGAIHKLIFYHIASAQPDIEIRLVRSPAMAVLNERFRGIRKPTDVLSFHMESSRLLGSVVIDVDTAKIQAKRYKHSLNREIQELFVHGVLHLLGFTHDRKRDTEVMRRHERFFIKNLP